MGLTIESFQYHFNWRPLYDQYMKNPSDYGIAIFFHEIKCIFSEGFKREYTAYRVSERNKLESMIDLKSRNELELMTDEKSVQGKALLVERIRIKKKEKAIRDMVRQLEDPFFSFSSAILPIN